MSVPATEVFEIVLYETAGEKSWLRTVFSFLSRAEAPPAGVIVSVVHTETGREVFRHIEDMGDDEDHLRRGIEQDLATMSAGEFEAAWGS